MNINSNGYTFGFAAVMVVLAALMLSITAMSLKDKQNKNIEMEKKQSILASIHLVLTREESESRFDEIIAEALVVNAGGTITSSDKKSAFNVKIEDQLIKPVDDRELPVFVAKKNDSTFYIVPVRGKGLWGPVWGFVALQSDLNTVYGTFFDHKAETPGLGAEITTDLFEGQYVGKQIANEASFGLIEMRKGDASGNHQVDGISGGTITSKGVEAMIQDCLVPYKKHFDALKATAPAPVDSTSAPAPSTES
jgi:Na+-transporting NADH:ubiquinone oxidoreductase subunit C